jgi:hypothetical protein
MKNFIALFLFVISFNLLAAELEGIQFADKVKLDNKDLVLNGIGIRKATFLKIKVYYGALYLENKTKDPQTFLSSNSPKQIVMHFVREVDAKKIKETFSEGLEAANKNTASVKAQMDAFTAQLQDMNKGDILVINFSADGVTPVIKGKVGTKVASAEFSHALLNIWFVNPKDENLKNGLLGQ